MNRARCFAKGLKILVFVVVVLALLGLATMSLWNWLIPALFAGPAVSYWQALGLLVLARLLFGGLRPHGRGRFGPWGHRWRQRWEQMTPEEREQLRSRWHHGTRDTNAGCYAPPPQEP